MASHHAISSVSIVVVTADVGVIHRTAMPPRTAVAAVKVMVIVPLAVGCRERMFDLPARRMRTLLALVDGDQQGQQPGRRVDALQVDAFHASG